MLEIARLTRELAEMTRQRDEFLETEISVREYAKQVEENRRLRGLMTRAIPQLCEIDCDECDRTNDEGRKCFVREFKAVARGGG